MKFNTITYLVTAAMTSFVLADNTNAIGATLRDIQATYQNADTNAALTGGRYNLGATYDRLIEQYENIYNLLGYDENYKVDPVCGDVLVTLAKQSVFFDSRTIRQKIGLQRGTKEFERSCSIFVQAYQRTAAKLDRHLTCPDGKLIIETQKSNIHKGNLCFPEV